MNTSITESQENTVVPINDMTMRVSSRVIAAGCMVEHESLMALIYKHKCTLENRLENKMGEIQFVIEPVKIPGQRGTKHIKTAWLTELQTSFLVSFTRNTENVVHLKCVLARSFDEFKRLASDQLEINERKEEERYRVTDHSAGHIYAISNGMGCVKIGLTKNNPEKRMADLQVANPYPLSLVCSFHSKNLISDEKYFHYLFAEHRLSGEWFKIGKAAVKKAFNDYKNEKLADAECSSELLFA